MREIFKPNGEVYARVWVDERYLQIQLGEGRGNPTIIMDPKVIPQLRQILTEAEFLKVI